MQSTEQRANTIAQELSAVYDDPITCQQYAWWVLEQILNKSKAELLAHDYKISSDQETVIQDWLHKLIDEKMPLQYLIGSVPFANTTILVNPPVLIPRPETEEWTVRLIEQLNKLKNQNLTILDLCTGSGCIAVAIAKAIPTAHIYACDDAEEALMCARQNVTHNMVSNVVLIKSDLFDELPEDIRYDLIVGNPPYIAPEEWDSLDEQVALWEDKHALIAADHGLKIISAIINNAPRYLKENSEMKEKQVPQLVLEIDRTQGQQTKLLMQHAGFCDVQVEKDLEGKDRIICGRCAPCGHSRE